MCSKVIILVVVIKMLLSLNLGNNLVVKGWRDVPVDKSVLGELSAEFVPQIKQVVIQADSKFVFITAAEFEKKLYDCRREMQVSLHLLYYLLLLINYCLGLFPRNQ